METFKLPNAFLDHQRGCIAWASLFQAIKAVVRVNAVSDDVRSCIKSWIKDPAPETALMGIAVVQTISLNASPFVRSQMAGPKWQERLEKTLAKPQSPMVGAAVAQVLADWAFLYGSEELGRVARATLNLPRHRAGTQDLRPSQVALDAADEAALGIPPVGPRKGIDFVAFYHQAMSTAHHSLPGASAGGGSVHNPSGHFGSSPAGPYAGNTGGSTHSVRGPGSAAGLGPGSALDLAALSRSSLGLGRLSGPQVLGRSVHGQGGLQSCQSLEALAAALSLSPTSPTSSAPVTPALVPSMTAKMAAQAEELVHMCRAARAAAAAVAGKTSAVPTGPRPVRLPPQITSIVDRGYEAAERCNAWRQRVGDATATLDDAGAVCALLGTLDTVNAALLEWQKFASGGELFRALGLSTPRTSLAAPQPCLLDFDDVPLATNRTAATAATAAVQHTYTPQLTGFSLLDEPAQVPAYPSNLANAHPVNPFAAAPSLHGASQPVYSNNSTTGQASANNPFGAAPAWPAPTTTVTPTPAPAPAPAVTAPKLPRPPPQLVGAWGWARCDSMGGERSNAAVTASSAAAVTPVTAPNSFVSPPPQHMAPPAAALATVPSQSPPQQVQRSVSMSPGAASAAAAGHVSLDSTAQPPTTAPAATAAFSTQLPCPTAATSKSAGVTAETLQPDWHAEFNTLISRLRISAGATGGIAASGALSQGVTAQLWGFVQRVQLHYEGQLSASKQQAHAELASTKERAVGVMKDLKQQLAASQAEVAALRAQLAQAQAAAQQQQQYQQQQQAQLSQQQQVAQAWLLQQQQQYSQQQQQAVGTGVTGSPSPGTPGPSSYKVLQLSQQQGQMAGASAGGVSVLHNLPRPPQPQGNGVYRRPTPGVLSDGGGVGAGAVQAVGGVDQNGWQLL